MLLGLRMLSYFTRIKTQAMIGRVIVTCLLLLAFTGNVLAIRAIPQRVCGVGGCVQPDKIQLYE
jgi:hypothetical protein